MAFDDVENVFEQVEDTAQGATNEQAEEPQIEGNEDNEYIPDFFPDKRVGYESEGQLSLIHI